MSWLWGNETTEQAQIVVSALQGELDERELKIQALEAALRREQHDFQQLLQSEIRELEAKRARIAHELRDVDALIADKQALLQNGKSDGAKKAPGKKKKTKAEAEAAAPGAPGATTTASTALEKKPSEKKKTKKKTQTTGVSTKPQALPMDDHVLKVAKIEPNVAFIIQRSTNANTVVYAGQLKGQVLDAHKPLDVYWLMFEKAGAPREDLNLIERNTAYGASCTPHASAPSQFLVSLASLKDRECVLLVDAVSGRVQARTTISGRPNVVLCRVFVQMTTGWVPTVDYVELFGVDPATHEAVYEKKSNK